MLVCPKHLAAYQKQQLSYIVLRISEDNLFKKILSCLWHYCAPKVEAIYLHNRVYIAYNRKGLTTFAVFCLSLFVATKEKPISGIGCRSPPFNLDFSKKFRLEVKRYGLQQAREEKKWRLWKEAEEKQLRKQRMQEAGTYLEGVADDTQQPEIKTVEDFLDSIGKISSSIRF